VVVSDLFVRKFLPEEDPIGRLLRVKVDGTARKSMQSREWSEIHAH
jgi:hypothetical protein